MSEFETVPVPKSFGFGKWDALRQAVRSAPDGIAIRLPIPADAQDSHSRERFRVKVAQAFRGANRQRAVRTMFDGNALLIWERRNGKEGA